MPVNSRAFVKPSFSERSVNPHNQNVLVTKVNKVREVKTEGYVTACVLADIMAIEHHHRIAKNAVKLDRDPFACVSLRQFERASIPTDTRFGIFSTHRFCAVMKNQRCVDKWQLDRPIMRQVDGSPINIIKIQTSHGQQIAGLCELRFSPSCAKTEIFDRIVRVS